MKFNCSIRFYSTVDIFLLYNYWLFNPTYILDFSFLRPSTSRKQDANATHQETTFLIPLLKQCKRQQENIIHRP